MRNVEKVIFCVLVFAVIAVSHMEDRRLDRQEAAVIAPEKVTVVAFGKR